MSATRIFFVASVKKSLLLLRRYTFDTAMRIVMFYVLFALLFFGGRTVAPTRLDETLGGLIVGYFLWITATSAYNTTASTMTREAEWGTLEQLYMSPLGIGRVVAVVNTVNLGTSLVSGLTLLVLMLVTTGRSLQVDLLTVVPLSLLTLALPIGVGLLLGGLALVYKRVGSVTGLIQFAFVGLIAAPVDAIPGLSFVPLTLGSHLLRRTMQEGIRLWELPPTELGLLTATAALSVGLGYLGFHVAQRTARRRGVLGHY